MIEESAFLCCCFLDIPFRRQHGFESQPFRYASTISIAHEILFWIVSMRFTLAAVLRLLNGRFVTSAMLRHSSPTMNNRMGQAKHIVARTKKGIMRRRIVILLLFLGSVYCFPFPLARKYQVVVLQNCRRHTLPLFAVTFARLHPRKLNTDCARL